MKAQIIELLELGDPKSIIQREGEPISELIDTGSLVRELNEQLRLYIISNTKEMNRAEEILNDFLEDDQAEDAIVLSSTTYLSVKDVRTILNIYAKSQEGQGKSLMGYDKGYKEGYVDGMEGNPHKLGITVF